MTTAQIDFSKVRKNLGLQKVQGRIKNPKILRQNPRSGNTVIFARCHRVNFNQTKPSRKTLPQVWPRASCTAHVHVAGRSGPSIIRTPISLSTLRGFVRGLGVSRRRPVRLGVLDRLAVCRSGGWRNFLEGINALLRRCGEEWSEVVGCTRKPRCGYERTQVNLK